MNAFQSNADRLFLFSEAQLEQLWTWLGGGVGRLVQGRGLSMVTDIQTQAVKQATTFMSHKSQIALIRSGVNKKKKNNNNNLFTFNNMRW